MQVEIERRYAAVLHHMVKREMESITPLLTTLVAMSPTDEAPFAGHVEPLVFYPMKLFCCLGFDCIFPECGSLDKG